MLSAIHADLAEKELLPDQHLVDSGYTTLANLVTSRSDHEVDLVGPTLKTHWYQAETGFDLTHFSIDWEAEQVRCPQGRISSSWTPVEDAGKSLIYAAPATLVYAKPIWVMWLWLPRSMSFN